MEISIKSLTQSLEQSGITIEITLDTSNNNQENERERHLQQVDKQTIHDGDELTV